MKSNLTINVVSALLSTFAIIPISSKAAIISAPLTISGITQEQVGPRANCSSGFGGTTIGTGISSLLGRVSLEANDCIAPAGNSFSFLGTMVFTMSSGDEFFADYGGYFTPTIFPSIFTLTNSFFKITGGTGNFLNASGGGTLLGGENIKTGLGLMQATGTISNFKNSNDSSEPKVAYQRIAGAEDNSIAAIAELNTSLIPGSITTLGDYFYQDQSGRILAVNTLPESGSWSLVGIGFACLAVMRRRKLRILQADHWQPGKDLAIERT